MWEKDFRRTKQQKIENQQMFKKCFEFKFERHLEVNSNWEQNEQQQ